MEKCTTDYQEVTRMYFCDELPFLLYIPYSKLQNNSFAKNFVKITARVQYFKIVFSD